MTLALFYTVASIVRRGTFDGIRLPSIAAVRRGGRLLCSGSPPEPPPPPCLFTVRLETADGLRVIEGVKKGTLLRTAMLRSGVSPHNEGARLINCRGIGSCGTCAVEVEGAVEPPTRSARESLRLSLPPHTAGNTEARGLRLACQCTVQGDVRLRKNDGFWGSGAKLAPVGSGRNTWLGDVEFMLDAVSPTAEPCSVCAGTELVVCPLCVGESPTCKACRGAGQVVCRSCFSGDPWDLEGIRAWARRRPD